jgi:EmrB/QacA subfamily drug resistance transporter
MHAQHSPTTHSHGAHGEAAHTPWTTLALLAIAQFMVILDVTVVNVALPSIGDALNFSGGDLQWVVTAYVLFTGGLMLFGGRMADLIGRRPVFLAGLGLFTAASLASGLAWSPAALIVSRALQGIGAAMLLPSALSIVTTSYVGPQRAKALAVWGAIGSAGAAAGVLFGGILTQTLGWQSVFFINVPVGIGVALAALHTLPAQRIEWPGRDGFDLTGATALMGGLIALLLAIDGTGQHGWISAYTGVCAALAGLLLAKFIRTERRTARPLVPTATWRTRSLVSSAVVMLIATGILVGAFFLNTLFLHHVMGASALETGLAFLPLTLVILAGAHLASQALPRLGSRWIVVVGLLLASTGAWLLAVIPDDPSYVVNLLPGYLFLGLGVGMTFVSVSVAAMADVPHESAGLASGLMTTAHEIGAAIGVAALATIATAGESGSLSGLVDGYSTAFVIVGSVAAVVAAIAAFALPSVRPEPGMAHGLH